jgi:anti-sigma regulatory factor (Ser/Thr protein kinase)
MVGPRVKSIPRRHASESVRESKVKGEVDLPAAALTRCAHEIINATMAELSAGEPVCTGVFLAAADQAGVARAFLRNHLADHPACDVGLLLTSELIANAIRHSGSRFFALTVTRLTQDRLRIAVIDEGRAGIPQISEATPEAEGGRGMAIIEALAASWGIIRRRGLGAAVWFEYSS